MKNFRRMGNFFIFLIIALIIFLLRIKVGSFITFESLIELKENFLIEFLLIYIVLTLTTSMLLVRKLEGGELLYYFGNGFTRERYLGDLLASELLLVIPAMIPFWTLYYVIWKYVDLNLSVFRAITINLLMIIYFILFLILLSYVFKTFILYLSINLALLILQSLKIRVPGFLLPLFPLLLHQRLFIDYLIGKDFALGVACILVMILGVIVWRLRYLLR